MVTYAELQECVEAGMAVVCTPTPAGCDFYAYRFTGKAQRRMAADPGYRLGVLIGLCVVRHAQVEAP